VTRAFNIGLVKPLDLSWGLETRWAQFAQVAGDPNSYVNGGYVVPADGTPFGDLYHGRLPTAGLQLFTGTTPADAGTHHRNNYALYVDLGTNVTDPWYAGVAARGEHYDDSSGNTLNGKLVTRYEILPELAVRAAVNNSFRAPSLAIGASQHLDHVGEAQSRAARPRSGTVGVSDVDQKISSKAPIGEKLSIDRVRIETGHRSHGESQRSCRNEQVSALQSPVAQPRNVSQRCISREEMGDWCARELIGEVFVESAVIRHDRGDRRTRGLLTICRRQRRQEPRLGLLRADEHVPGRLGIEGGGSPISTSRRALRGSRRPPLWW
jgi:hypothetical protein